MHVHCSTCDELWDVYHLRHEAVFETSLTHPEAEAWRGLPGPQKLAPSYRGQFEAIGWQFGRTVINVIRCPCCPEGAGPMANRVATKAALEKLFTDDEDRLAVLYENYRL